MGHARFFKRIIALLLPLALLFALCACGQTGSGSTSTPGASAPPASGTPPTSSVPPSPDGASSETPGPQSGGTSAQPAPASSLPAPSSQPGGAIDIPFGQTKTFEGLLYNSDGQPTTVTVAMGISRVSSGQDAYDVLKASDPSIAAPRAGTEYVIADVTITYVSGGLDSLNLMESHGSSRDANAFFSLSDKSLTADEQNTNANQVTGALDGSFYDLSVSPGETAHGQVAFWRTVGSTEPLNYWGFGQSINLSLQ